MPTSRRSLIAGTAAVPLANIGRARAAEFSFKAANTLPVEHPLNIRASEACARITEATRGQVEIKLFPDSKLGSDTEALKTLQSGEVESWRISRRGCCLVRPRSQVLTPGPAFF